MSEQGRSGPRGEDSYKMFVRRRRWEWQAKREEATTRGEKERGEERMKGMMSWRVVVKPATYLYSPASFFS